MDELKTHIVSSICVVFVLICPLFFECNIFWLLSVLILIGLMVVRSSMAEIPACGEKIFIALNLVVVVIFILASFLM